MSPHHQRWINGPRLAATLTIIMLLLCAWIAAMRQFEVEGVRMVIRFTARSSLLLFCLAFAASSLARLWPAGGTRWLLRNRGYIGLSFVASHLIHAVAIACFAAMAPPLFKEATSPASFIFGGVGYAFIIAMAATSFDRSAAAIGTRAWKILHTSGIYYLWFQFMVSFGMRIPQMPNYIWFLAPLIIAMVVRFTAILRARKTYPDALGIQ
jgi:sulfoxide reductase heme-binding subunit YedZ